jgi:hypothetical protein
MTSQGCATHEGNPTSHNLQGIEASDEQAMKIGEKLSRWSAGREMYFEVGFRLNSTPRR